MAGVIEQVLSPEIAEDEWDWDELEDALAGAVQPRVRAQPRHARRGRDAGLAEDREAARRAREGAVARRGCMYFLRHFSLEEIDQQWIEHLKTMDALREGIGLQGYGQKDPKKEYKKVGFAMFTEMMDRIQENTISKLFRVQIQSEEAGRSRRSQEKERADWSSTASPTRPRTSDEAGRSGQQRRGAVAARRARPATAPRPSRCARAAQGRPQRSVPVRLGQEVQEVPRQGRRSRGLRVTSPRLRVTAICEHAARSAIEISRALRGTMLAPHPMRIGVPKEIKTQEFRVGMTPAGVAILTHAATPCSSSKTPASARRSPTRRTSRRARRSSPPRDEVWGTRTWS